MTAALLSQVLAEQLPGEWIDQTDMGSIPLHPNTPADPARWCAVIGSLDLYAPIQMHRTFTALVIAEWFYGQFKQRRAFLGKHRRDLPFRRAMNARIGPAFFPSVEVLLSFLQTFEAQALQWRLLCVSNSGFNFAFAVRVLNATGQSNRAIVMENVPVQRVERRIIHVGP